MLREIRQPVITVKEAKRFTRCKLNILIPSRATTTIFLINHFTPSQQLQDLPFHMNIFLHFFIALNIASYLFILSRLKLPRVDL